MIGPTLPGEIIFPLYMRGLRSIHKYIVVALSFIIPLLNLFYGLHRYIIITHPQLIAKYCNKKVTVALIVTIILVSGALSIHELFDLHSFSLLGLNSFFMGRNEGWHEGFSGVINIVALLSEATLIFILFSMVTKKMNACLSENIHFLNSMDGVKYETRAASYMKITKLNSGFLIVSMISVSVDAARAILVDLYVVHMGLNPTELYNPVITGLLLTMEFLSCLDVLLFPSLVLWYMPVVKEFVHRLMQSVKKCLGSTSVGNV